MAAYLERLAARTAAVGSVLCLGLDPDPAALPAGFPPTLAGVERFCQLLLEVGLPYAAAVKPNLAFFEAFGSPGVAALERIRASIPASIPVVADAKRGDIGSTAAFQAVALFDVLGADAITANPYVGAEGLRPFLERGDRYTYVLCRTSNPGSDEFQALPVGAADGQPAEEVHERIARHVAGWGPGGTVGLVVGATAPDRAPPDPADRAGPGLPGPGRRGPGWRRGPDPGRRSGERPSGRRPARCRAARQRLAGDRPGRPGSRSR